MLIDERIKYCEDNAFNFDYVGVIQTYVCLNVMGYNYRRGRADSMSKWDITPHMRQHFAIHMYRFCDKIPKEDMENALRENRSLSRIMWNCQVTDVIVDILEKKSAEAKAKMKTPLACAIVNSFSPKTKKDRVLHYFWRKSFFLFCLFVKLFYKNIGFIKRLKRFSRFLTH